MQAPALIFRSGAVNEGDVLSLLGRPRSRESETRSPARQYSALLDPSSSTTRNGEGISPIRPARLAAPGVIAPGSLEQIAPWAGQASPIRSRVGYSGEDSSESEAEGNVSVAGVESDRHLSSMDGNGGGQPLLLSLADLTTAGLQKLLQAEGGSKMFFDPDAQRWVGEEVDLSGFEDTLPGETSSGGSASFGDSAPFTAGDGSAGAFAGALPAVSSRGAQSKSPFSVPSPLRKYDGRYSKHSSSAHRRWSSGETFSGLISKEQSRTSGPKREKVLPGGRSHRRRHSTVESGPVLLGNGGSAALGSGGPPSAERTPISKVTSRFSAHASPVASSSFRSDSDTGSVIRLWEEGARVGDRAQGGPHGDGKRMDDLRRRRSANGSGDGGAGENGKVSGSNNGSGGYFSRAAPTTRAPSVGGRAGHGGGGVAGGDEPMQSRLSEVFEDVAVLAPPKEVAPKAPPSPVRGTHSSPAINPTKLWAVGRHLSADKSVPFNFESFHASGSEFGASETSDWDQVCM